MRGMGRGGLPGEGKGSVRTILPGRKRKDDATDTAGLNVTPTVRLADVAV